MITTTMKQGLALVWGMSLAPKMPTVVWASLMHLCYMSRDDGPDLVVEGTISQLSKSAHVPLSTFKSHVRHLESAGYVSKARMLREDGGNAGIRIVVRAAFGGVSC